MTKLKKKGAFDLTFVLKVLCMIAMVAFVACMFLDFYQYKSVTEESHRQHVLSGGKIPEVEETRVVSLADYIWMSEDHVDLFGDWEAGMYNFEGKQFKQNDLVMMPFVGTLLVVFGLIFFLWKKKSLWPCLFGVIAGGYGTYMYLTDPAGVYKPFAGMATRPGATLFDAPVEAYFKAGINYHANLIAAIALLVLSVAVMVPWVIRVTKWFTVKKRHY